MKDILIVLGSTILFFIVVIGILIGVQKDIFRLPVYYNPNGLVVNVNPEYREFWGQKLSLEDIEFAKDLNSKFSFAEHEVRIYDKYENFQIGRFFFMHIKKMKIIGYFFSDILMSLIAFVVAIWFFYYIRDLYIFLFFIASSSIILANFLFLAFESYHFYLMFSLYFTSFSLFNLSFRFRGKEIQTKWIIPQLILASLAGFIAETETNNYSVLTNLGTIGLVFSSISIIIAMLSIAYDIFRYDQQSFILKRKLSLLVSLVVLLLIPFSVLSSDALYLMEYPRVIFLFLFLIFLVSFIYGTYRYSLIPAQIFFNPTIITFIQVTLIVGTYIILLTFLNFYSPFNLFKNENYFNYFFLFITIIYSIQLKSYIRSFVNYYSFKRNENLSKSLEMIGNLISSPIAMKMVVGSINKSMMETLKVNKILLLLPSDQFMGSDMRNINFTRISKDSDIWKFFMESKEITVTSHLAYGVGFRENLHSYLTGMGIQIAFPIKDLQLEKQNKAILLIGEKINKQNFSLGELRYIREVSRLASMLLDNYALLADEIEKKKIIRKLHTASVLDHTLNLIDEPASPRLNFGYISIPAVEISGDYFDFVSLWQNKAAFFLGDVSGHGLGTGYIVTAIKAIVRDLISEETSLEEIFETVNLFLKEKYDGNEFMTLLGGYLNFKTGNFEYINAGHPGIIQISSDGNLITHSKTQRVLGILNTNYTTQELVMEPGDKLILYSDGVTETFGESDRLFGEEELFQFLKKNLNARSHELPQLLNKALNQFRHEKELTDDTTFVCLELVSEEESSDS
ncbi:MAG: serine/threonine-protein phosphatase [Leptospira sp.]|nr:serine/threonine-protein phosphatase [Leptospira sp.]